MFAMYGILSADHRARQDRARPVHRHLAVRRGAGALGLGDHRVLGHRHLAAAARHRQPHERALPGLQRRPTAASSSAPPTSGSGSASSTSSAGRRWRSDPRYVDNKDRVANREVLARELGADVPAPAPPTSGSTRFLEAGVPAGPINAYVEAFDNDHAREREAMIEIDHPVEGKFKALGFPVKMSGDGPAVRMPPPLLGEHTGRHRRAPRARRPVRRAGGAQGAFGE